MTPYLIIIEFSETHRLTFEGWQFETRRQARSFAQAMATVHGKDGTIAVTYIMPMERANG